MATNCPRKHSSSGDKFSFPVIIQDSDQFEFGSITSPGSPTSPADHLFSNGKLLPHPFPIQTPSYSRSTSRASSKDSWISSRSNSTNSRSSTCSSARTSTSEASERRLLPRRERIVRPALSCQYQYGSSRRWQLVAAAPVLKHQVSSLRKVDNGIDPKASRKLTGEDEESRDSKSWFGRRFFKSFVSTCKECHAIKT